MNRLYVIVRYPNLPIAVAVVVNTMFTNVVIVLKEVIIRLYLHGLLMC
jgi:hypothetical protein